MAKKLNNKNIPRKSSGRATSQKVKRSDNTANKKIPNPHPAELAASLLELSKLQTILIKHLFRQL